MPGRRQAFLSNAGPFGSPLATHRASVKHASSEKCAFRPVAASVVEVPRGLRDGRQEAGLLPRRYGLSQNRDEVVRAGEDHGLHLLYQSRLVDGPPDFSSSGS